MKTTFFELHIHILYRKHIIKKKNIKNILSNRKSKTKISKINPSDRLISQKITVQSTLYETIAYTWGGYLKQSWVSSASMSFFMQLVHVLLSYTRESKSWPTCPHLSFVAYFWVQQGSLLYSLGRKNQFGFLQLLWEGIV